MTRISRLYVSVTLFASLCLAESAFAGEPFHPIYEPFIRFLQFIGLY